MTKGAKIGIGIGIGVALAIGSYFLFFRKKDEENDSNENDSNKNVSYNTLYLGQMSYLQNVKDKPRIWVHLDTKPNKDKFKKGDIAVIEKTSFDGEYPVYGTWVNQDGKIVAFSIDINKKYVAINDKDETFANYGKITIKRKI